MKPSTPFVRELLGIARQLRHLAEAGIKPTQMSLKPGYFPLVYIDAPPSPEWLRRRAISTYDTRAHVRVSGRRLILVWTPEAAGSSTLPLSEKTL